MSFCQLVACFGSMLTTKVFCMLQLFCFEMGGGFIVAVSGYELVNHLWVTNGKYCSTRSPLTMSKFIKERNSTFPGMVIVTKVLDLGLCC